MKNRIELDGEYYTKRPDGYKHKTKPIIMIGLEQETRFNSTCEAAEYISKILNNKCYSGTITHALKGDIKQAYGYRWKYE